MLQPGEREDNHDKICAMQYAALLELGAYDDEFALFGFVYLENGSRHCYVSGMREKTIAHYELCRAKNMFPTNIESKVIRMRINSGEKESVQQQLKLEFAHELEKKYPKHVLIKLRNIGLESINNKAKNDLDKIRCNLEGCFNEDTLELFSGIVHLAYEKNILSVDEYYQNLDWVKRESDFSRDRIRPKTNMKRLLSGFAYYEGKTLKYYTNAVYEKVLARRIELISKGKQVSPIYKKIYYFNFAKELYLSLDEFDKDIAEKMNEDYMALIAYLYTVKSDANKEEFEQLIGETQDKYKNRNLNTTLNYYYNIWC